MSMTRPAGPWTRSRPAAATAATERRVDDLDRRIDDLDRKLDNRFMWLLAAFAAGFMALGGLILNRTDAVTARIEAVDTRLGDRIDAVDKRLSALSERTARIEARLPPQR